MSHGSRPALCCVALAAAAFAHWGGESACFAQPGGGGSPRQPREYLEARVRDNPEDASGWRMLGKVRAQTGDVVLAGEALERAVALDPRNVAANFDLGELLANAGRLPAAADKFRHVTRLAPQSEYAREARERLARMPPELAGEVVPAGYEIKRFDAVDQTGPLLKFEPLPEPRRPYSLHIETGALYNTNAALTPTSREFFASTAESFQGFFNPDIEYRLLDGDLWRAGPRFIGYFNLNEGPFSSLNLQSYQPAFFAERSVPLASTVLVPRAQYAFTHDAFQGQMFANRHALTTSLTSFWDTGNTTIGYWTGDYTNFADDGGDPAASSRDGFNTAVGASHVHLVDLTRVRALSGGVEFQYADTVGTNFSFAGVSLHGEIELPLAETWSAVLEGGWGYRDYFESALVPSRNENIWWAGARVRKFISPNWSVAAVASYNRFDSANTFFQAERLIAGIVSIHEF